MQTGVHLFLVTGRLFDFLAAAVEQHAGDGGGAWGKLQ